jgi:hypothetical protein
MPARRISEGERALYEHIRTAYAEYLTVVETKNVLGLKDWHSARDWLEDVPRTHIGKRDKWSAREIARKLWRDTEVLA